MGIFKRIKHIAVADVHNFLDTFEDPVSMVKQYLREMEEQFGKAQQALSNQLIIEKRYETLISHEEEAIAKRTRQANLAVDHGEEAIALMALQEKINHEERLHIYREQQQTVKQQTEQLTEELKRLAELYSDLENRKQYLLSRANAAKAIQHINTALHPFNTDPIERGFARMEEKIWLMDTGARVSRQANRILNGASTTKVQEQISESAKRELEKLKFERNQA
jgi:phage shock protein A